MIAATGEAQWTFLQTLAVTMAAANACRTLQMRERCVKICMSSAPNALMCAGAGTGWLPHQKEGGGSGAGGGIYGGCEGGCDSGNRGYAETKRAAAALDTVTAAVLLPALLMTAPVATQASTCTGAAADERPAEPATPNCMHAWSHIPGCLPARRTGCTKNRTGPHMRAYVRDAATCLGGSASF